jgi:hypothetical protein
MNRKTLSIFVLAAMILSTIMILMPTSLAAGIDSWSIGDYEPTSSILDGKDEFKQGGTWMVHIDYYIGINIPGELQEGIAYPGGEVEIHFSILTPGYFKFHYARYGSETDLIYFDGMELDPAVGLGEGVHSEFFYTLKIMDQNTHSIKIKVIESGFNDGHYFDYFGLEPLSAFVDIDIKPGSCPNSINLKSKGVVPVAVLTTENFDASTIEPDTVEFADAHPVRYTMEDVDGDGDLDMLFHFKTQDLDLVKDSTEAALTGETTDGTLIEGWDTVKIVPKK